ncbi:osiris 10a isoform X2 [Leptinotarsa decemlineata]|uniref:osiris 10a isoform X2 n=1 Tax=Leptinotarsa decemlineata TaxID=7539 RepID=UPI003D304445
MEPRLESLVDSFSYVFSKRNTRWDMGFLYPGLAIRISPSVHQGGTLEFTLDSHRESLNVHSLKEAGTGRLLARQFLLPFLLGFKFNVASLIPILFGILALIAKKALIISKIALIVTSALALGSLLLGNDKYQQHHYAPNQFGHPGYEGIHGYNRYPGDDHDDIYYRRNFGKQSDQLNVYPNIAKSLEGSESGDKTSGRNFVWEEKDEKLQIGNV